MSTFPERVKVVIQDDELRSALEKATSKMDLLRRSAISGLEDSDAIRDAARRAKFEVLNDLDTHLLRFEEKLTGNGVTVHWAETGADACDIVHSIAKKFEVKNIVKSKSMVTEEIFLNKSLIENGYRVVETDLGEYIVQLADEKPSHVIAPIIHMSKERVGQIMHEKIDVPYTDDIQKMARNAREKLRKEFMEADMGITGANFGVSETGTVCLVTNEGNARMVTSLPRVHVVMMGIEKLIPTLSDLDNMLKILARSATGQKLTSYTTLFHGPAASKSGGGPQELHVILLDNGRTNVLNSEQAEILGCIRCGACFNVCPVFKSIGGHAYGDTYPGPVGSVLTPGLRGDNKWNDLAYASPLCGACMEVCPVRLDIPKMLTGLRKQAVQENSKAGNMKITAIVFRYLMIHPKIYAVLRKMLIFIPNLISKDGWIKRSRIGMLKNWTKYRDFKAPAPKTFSQMWVEKQNKSD